MFASDTRPNSQQETRSGCYKGIRLDPSSHQGTQAGCWVQAVPLCCSAASTASLAAPTHIDETSLSYTHESALCRSTANEVALKMAFRKFRHDHAEGLSVAATPGQDMELHVSTKEPAHICSAFAAVFAPWLMFELQRQLGCGLHLL